MKTIRVFLAMLLAIQMICLPVFAANPNKQNPLKPGKIVRITSKSLSQPIVGKLVSTTPDSLTIMTKKGNYTSLEKKQIQKLDLNTTNIGKSAFAGFLTGAFVGALLGSLAATERKKGDLIEFGPEIIPVFAVIIGTPVGLLGAMLGAFPRWKSVPLEQVRMSLSVQKNTRQHAPTTLLASFAF